MIGMAFSRSDIPNLTGKQAIVTGSNSGTGYETALALAAKGADVVMAARNADKAQAAIRKIVSAHPAASVRFEVLDLASQASVKAFAYRLLEQGRPIDILINNAGVMALPQRQVSEDGFELQMATNYFGHFALTARLMPLLKAGQARIVQLSSIAHRQGTVRLDDLNASTQYNAWPVYAQSKLAMLMFGLELDRRSRAGAWGLTSVVAHPGYARTGLIANGPLGDNGVVRWGFNRIFRPFIEPLVSHSAADGALPILIAATSDQVGGGDFIGPQRLRELKGPPGPAKAEPQALDEIMAARLWTETQHLTGVAFA